MAYLFDDDKSIVKIVDCELNVGNVSGRSARAWDGYFSDAGLQEYETVDIDKIRILSVQQVRYLSESEQNPLIESAKYYKSGDTGWQDESIHPSALVYRPVGATKNQLHVTVYNPMGAEYFIDAKVTLLILE